MSLRDGTKKMSKSDPSDYSRIMLSDNSETISQKIKKAKTDPFPLPDNLEDAKNRPEALNLLAIYASLNNQTTEDVIKNYGNKEFSGFKKDLADLIVDKISPIEKEMKKLMDDIKYLDQIMINGKEKAVVVADSVLNKVYEVVGLPKP